MKVLFKNIGRNNINFEKYKDKEDITYEWLLEQIQPYLLSNNIDILEDNNNEKRLYVFAGMQTVGEIELLNFEDLLDNALDTVEKALRD